MVSRVDFILRKDVNGHTKQTQKQNLFGGKEVKRGNLPPTNHHLTSTGSVGGPSSAVSIINALKSNHEALRTRKRKSVDNSVGTLKSIRGSFSKKSDRMFSNDRK
jgi:hypothetical protein